MLSRYTKFKVHQRLLYSIYSCISIRGKADYVEWTFPRQTGCSYYITISNKSMTQKPKYNLVSPCFRKEFLSFDEVSVCNRRDMFYYLLIYLVYKVLCIITIHTTPWICYKYFVLRVRILRESKSYATVLCKLLISGVITPYRCVESW